MSSNSLFFSFNVMIEYGLCLLFNNKQVWTNPRVNQYCQMLANVMRPDYRGPTFNGNQGRCLHSIAKGIMYVVPMLLIFVNQHI